MSTVKKKAAFSAPLKTFALSFPGAYEDHPWGETVAKVAKKVFVFLGHAEYPQYGITVKLPRSRLEALQFGFTEPTGYGLGKSGWVTVRLDKGAEPPTDLMLEWIEESYRAVAPKKLIAEWDGRPLAAQAPKAAHTKKKAARGKWPAARSKKR